MIVGMERVQKGLKRETYERGTYLGWTQRQEKRRVCASK
jgi:hypothetical protein